MSTVGDTALGGGWEIIGAQYFDLKDDYFMEFEGRTCRITDSTGNLVEEYQFGEQHGYVEREVFRGCRIYVLDANVKFQKKS
jgi:hypothetical protein